MASHGGPADIQLEAIHKETDPAEQNLEQQTVPKMPWPTKDKVAVLANKPTLMETVASALDNKRRRTSTINAIATGKLSQSIKCVLVGPPATGKSAIITSLISGGGDKLYNHIPTVFDNYTVDIKEGKTSHDLRYSLNTPTSFNGKFSCVGSGTRGQTLTSAPQPIHGQM